jgi:Cdc6-like AAA superfamily ATPase
VRDSDTSVEERHILDSLSKIDYANQQSDYLSAHEPGTGESLLRSPEFITWMTSTDQTLYCPGAPGAGKTIQASIVVKRLCDQYVDAVNVGVAYQYYNFQRDQDQKPELLVANLIKQLSQCRHPLHSSVRLLYEQTQKKGYRPSLQELLETFQLVTSSYSRVFIVLDALDEFSDLDRSRTKFLDGLFSVQKNHGFNIFATSRSIPEIEKRFANHPSIPIHPSKDDIFTYLENFMYQLPDFVQTDEELKEEVKAQIESASDGM